MGIWDYGSQGVPQYSQLFSLAAFPSHCLIARPESGGGCNLPGEGEPSAPASLRGSWGLKVGCLQSALAARNPAFNRQGRTFLWTAFLKELTEDYELCSDYACFDSERINLHLGGGQQTVRSLLYSMFSKQTRQDDSLRWQREECSTWISLEIPVVFLWTQGRNECTGSLGQRSGESRDNKSRRGWGVPLVLNWGRWNLLSCCVTPDIRRVGCWRSSRRPG